MDMRVTPVLSTGDSYPPGIACLVVPGNEVERQALQWYGLDECLGMRHQSNCFKNNIQYLLYFSKIILTSCSSIEGM